MIRGEIIVRAMERDERVARLPDLARLRIAVFRDWPYLYDGDLAYEEAYLRDFLADPASVVIAAMSDDRLVGAATAAPLANHHAEFAEPFEKAGMAPHDWFYLAESVLLPEARGLGIGHAFFDERERAALSRGFTQATFCAVVRPDDHPGRPAEARDLAPFWRKRGYIHWPDLVANFSWRDIGEANETAKPMQFWARTLEP